MADDTTPPPPADEPDELERELAPKPILPDTLQSLDQDDEEEEPQEEEDEKVWAWRTPNPKLVTPFLFRYPFVGDNWTREVVLRAADGSEEDLLLDDSGTYKDSHARMNLLLSRCTVSVGGVERPPGAKAERDGSVAPGFFTALYDSMPLQNRIAAILRLRQLTTHLPERAQSGHKFLFNATCPAKGYGGCGRMSKGHLVRLDTIKVVQAPDAFCKEEPHVFEAGGYKIEWRLPTGADEPKLHKVVTERHDALVTGVLFVSILSINGTAPRKFDDLKKLPSSVRTALRDDIDCAGVDIAVIVLCPHCHREFQIALPWQQKSFFFPSARE